MSSRDHTLSVIASAACLLFSTTLICSCGSSHSVGATKLRASTLQFEPRPNALPYSDAIPSVRHPKLGVDSVSSGTMYMLAVVGEGDTSRLALFTSNNGGDTFERPVWVSEKDEPVSSHGENSPALIVRPDVMYAAWNADGDIRLARSLSWGSSFERPVRISDKPPKAFSGYVSIGVAANGDVYAVWLDTRESTPKEDVYSLYLARSTDRGASFGKIIRVASHVCECCRPNVAFGPDGEVLVFWRHIYPGSIRDMTVAVTRDGGQSFSAPIRIAEDNWKLEGCPDSGVAVARAGRRVYAAWLTEASPAIGGVRLTWSDDAGKTWAPAILASQKVLDANYPALSPEDDRRVALIFQGRNREKSNGWAPTAAFVVEISPSGTLSVPLEIPGLILPAERPTVVSASNGRIFTAWTSTRDGKPWVFLARARKG